MDTQATGPRLDPTARAIRLERTLDFDSASTPSTSQIWTASQPLFRSDDADSGQQVIFEVHSGYIQATEYISPVEMKFKALNVKFVEKATLL